MEPVNKGTIFVAKSLPIFTFPAFKEKPQGLPLSPAGILRSSLVYDLGTPNLGTSWTIDSISLFYEQFSYFFANVAVGAKAKELWFYVVTYLYVGGAEVFREASEKISHKTPEGTIEGETTTSLLALQNLPNPVTVPGGQQVLLEMAVEETPGTNSNFHVGGEMTRGKVTMNYSLMDYHTRRKLKAY